MGTPADDVVPSLLPNICWQQGYPFQFSETADFLTIAVSGIILVDPSAPGLQDAGNGEYTVRRHATDPDRWFSIDGSRRCFLLLNDTTMRIQITTEYVVPIFDGYGGGGCATVCENIGFDWCYGGTAEIKIPGVVK